MLGVLFPDMAFLGNRGINPLLRLILRIEALAKIAMKAKRRRSASGATPLLRFLRLFVLSASLGVFCAFLLSPDEKGSNAKC